MKNNAYPTARPPRIKGLPEYYITPTRDFTKYTRDCEEKYWSKEKAFDWDQNVRANLEAHLSSLAAKDFSKVAFMVLPMVMEKIKRKIRQIREKGLPLNEDGLKDIGECLPSNKTSIQQCLTIQLPLEQLYQPISKLADQLEILESELLDLKEQQRLGLIRRGVIAKPIKSKAEKLEQITEVNHLNNKISYLKKQLHNSVSPSNKEEKQRKDGIHTELGSMQQKVLTELKATLEMLEQTLRAEILPKEPLVLSQLKDLILKRQLRGLKDIANHALVVEQSAIAPLTMGIIHYKRHREIQEALTTFINDEAKHSATFRRYLVEKLDAKEFIPSLLIKGANRYMWIARFFPGTGLFLAVIVEAIGAAYLEFFGDEQYMPDPLFCSICKTISEQDEKRHMDLCVDIYNELYRKGSRWERFRNQTALNGMLKSVYGDKTEDHHLIQAFLAFGVESNLLYQHIADRLSQQLSRISMYVEPKKLLYYIKK